MARTAHLRAKAFAIKIFWSKEDDLTKGTRTNFEKIQRRALDQMASEASSIETSSISAMMLFILDWFYWMYSPLAPRSKSLSAKFTLRIALAVTVVSLGGLYLSWNWNLQQVRLDLAVPTVSPAFNPKRDVTAEKYVTLLAPSTPHPWDDGQIDVYFETVTMIAHRLLHNEATKDPFNREFVVLATEAVKPRQVEILRTLGAHVRRVNALGPPSNVDPANVYQR